MKKPTVYTKAGAPSKSAVTLSKDVFDNVPSSHDLLQQVYDSYLARGRNAHAKTKLRGEVRGGGKKPWRQKGTGRARVGSIRSPIWRGGGITFGPTGAENHVKKVNKQAKHTAIKQALSLALDSGKISIIDVIESKDGKTKDVQALLNKLGATGAIVLVVADKSDSLLRATQNIPTVQLVQDRYLNVYDILNSDTIIVEKTALENIEQWLGGEKE